MQFQEILDDMMKDPEFKKGYEALEWNFEGLKIEVSSSIVELRIEKGWTQKALGKRIGTSQEAISRLEGGHNLTLKTLQKIAEAGDKKVKIRFVDR